MVIRRIGKRSFLMGVSRSARGLLMGKGDKNCQFLTIFSLWRLKTKSAAAPSLDSNWLLLKKKG